MFLLGERVVTSHPRAENEERSKHGPQPHHDAVSAYSDSKGEGGQKMGAEIPFSLFSLRLAAERKRKTVFVHVLETLFADTG